MSNLNTRSRIAIRWTTYPADIGYDGNPSDWLNSKPEMRSLHGALAFNYELSQRIGPGAYRLISYKHRGREVSLDEIRSVLEDAEYDRLNRRG